MKKPPTKKFKVTFEIEAIPYNKETFELLGPCYMEEYPEDVFLREDVSDILKLARAQALWFYLKSKGEECDEKRLEFRDKIIDQIEDSYTVEPS